MKRLVAVLAALVAAVAGGVVLYEREKEAAMAADPRRNLTGAGVPLQPQPRGADVGLAHLVAPVGEPDMLSALARWVPAAPVGRLQRLAAYVWAAPLSLLGLLAGASSGSTPTVLDGIVWFAPAGGPVMAVLGGLGFRAITLGHVVVSQLEPTPALIAHEHCHARQAERLGPLMGPLYLVLLARYGYARHPMERAARRAARDVRAAR